jgi:hypothetical protein
LLIASAALALGAGTMPAANAAIELGDGLSVTGFADMSYWSNDKDGDPGSFGIDQFETDFLFTGTDGVSAEVDIEYGDSNAPGGPAGGTETFVEQAFVTKSFTDMFSVKVGRFLSYSGWEAEEPTGLFQYSGSGYAQYFYGYYQQGVSAYYKGGKFDLMGSVVTHPFDGWTYETDQVGYEVGAAVMPVEGLTAKLFYIVDTVDGADDNKIINFWTSYAWNGFTFAGEYNNAKYSGPSKGDGYLLMANYASGPWGITLRYVDYDIKDGLGGSLDKDKSITLSPSYKVGDNLLLVGEVRRDDSFGFKSNSFALEALFSF